MLANNALLFPFQISQLNVQSKPSTPDMLDGKHWTHPNVVKPARPDPEAQCVRRGALVSNADAKATVASLWRRAPGDSFCGDDGICRRQF